MNRLRVSDVRFRAGVELARVLNLPTFNKLPLLLTCNEVVFKYLKRKPGVRMCAQRRPRPRIIFVFFNDASSKSFRASQTEAADSNYNYLPG